MMATQLATTHLDESDDDMHDDLLLVLVKASEMAVACGACDAVDVVDVVALLIVQGIVSNKCFAMLVDEQCQLCHPHV